MASRDLYSGMQSELESSSLFPIIMFHGEFTGGDVYMTTYDRTISWDGQTWIGVGNFAGISSVRETQELSARSVDLVLSGIPQELLQVALAEVTRGTRCHLYLGVIDSSGNLITNTTPQSPYKFYTGFIDVPVIDTGRDTCSIALKTENHLIILDRANERRYTHQDQQIDFEGDLGLNFVAEVQNKDIDWKS